jgi:hypothetical protein
LPASAAARLETLERQERHKRLILVGALGSFLALFGLTVVQDQQPQPAATAAVAPIVSNQPATTAGVQSSNVSGTVSIAPASSAARPKVRTRSS